MRDITKASRVNTALQVIHHMNEGLTVVEACRAVGIPRSSFYYIVENNPEAIAEVQAIIDANNREQLGLMLLSKTEMLRKVIQAGLAEETKPKDRLAIFIKLSELVDGLTKGIGMENDIENQAHEFLKHGSKLLHAKSRFTATKTIITIKSEA
jgi:hypothetical protein